MNTFVVSFMSAEGVVQTQEVSENVSNFLDAVRNANDAHSNMQAAAVDAIAELFGNVKIPKNASAQIALEKLKAYDAGMAQLRGLLYPTHDRFEDFRAAVAARDALPKGKREAQQREVSAIRTLMKSRIEYIVTQSLSAYVADVLGLEYANGKKRTERQRLETLIKALTTLKTKGKDESVKAECSAMLDASTQARQTWAARLKKSKAGTLEAFPPKVRKPRSTKPKLTKLATETATA